MDCFKALVEQIAVPISQQAEILKERMSMLLEAMGDPTVWEPETLCLYAEALFSEVVSHR
jgi:hypothetical protein